MTTSYAVQPEMKSKPLWVTVEVIESACVFFKYKKQQTNVNNNDEHAQQLYTAVYSCIYLSFKLLSLKLYWFLGEFFR